MMTQPRDRSNGQYHARGRIDRRRDRIVRWSGLVSRELLAALVAGAQVVRAATPEPTQMPFAMGGGPPASQIGDPILALVAVVVLGSIAAAATLILARVTGRIHSKT